MKKPIGRIFPAIAPNGMIHGVDEENNVFVHVFDRETMEGTWKPQAMVFVEMQEKMAKMEQDAKVKSMLIPGLRKGK